MYLIFSDILSISLLFPEHTPAGPERRRMHRARRDAAIDDATHSHQARVA